MATRNFVQKEAGTIAYQLREKHDLRGESDTDNPALAVSVVGSRTVTADELAKEIAASCTIKEADVAGVLTALSQRVQSTLLDGNRVELGAIGTLSVTLTCGNKHRADKVKARDISVRRIAFAPSKELSNAMRSAKMGIPAWQRGPMLGEHTDEVLAELGYTAEQIEAMKANGAATQIDMSQYIK